MAQDSLLLREKVVSEQYGKLKVLVRWLSKIPAIKPDELTLIPGPMW